MLSGSMRFHRPARVRRGRQRSNAPAHFQKEHARHSTPREIRFSRRRKRREVAAEGEFVSLQIHPTFDQS